MGRTVVVDAENVRRSVWPNVTREDLVRLCGTAAVETDAVVVVFDGLPPAVEPPAGVRLVGEAGRSADDLIAELAAGAPDGLVVATSDRGLRARLPTAVELVGGGRYVRRLLGRPV